MLYALTPFKRQITLPDGKVMIREFKAGDVLYSDEQVHVGENVGATPTHVIMVEMKREGTVSRRSDHAHLELGALARSEIIWVDVR